MLISPPAPNSSVLNDYINICHQQPCRFHIINHFITCARRVPIISHSFRLMFALIPYQAFVKKAVPLYPEFILLCGRLHSLLVKTCIGWLTLYRKLSHIYGCYLTGTIIQLHCSLCLILNYTSRRNLLPVRPTRSFTLTTRTEIALHLHTRVRKPSLTLAWKLVSATFYHE